MKHHDHTRDADGNLIQVGMSAVSHGKTWVVGYAWNGFVRLDRHKESIFLGRKRLCLIGIIGFKHPTFTK